MTDILLINPPSTSVQNNPMPFGLAYLASFLEKNKYSVKILDLSIERMSEQQILNYISRINPKNIGISCMSVHVDFVDRITKKIKENFSSIKIIVGGIHPTALPEKSAKNLKNVDIFVLGEGEITLLELMKNKKLEKINGIAYIKNKKVKINPPREFMQNLDIIPFPARHLLPDMKKYTLGFDWEGKKPSATVFSSRGCPFNCIYCASKVMWKQRIRLRSAENVLNEIDFLVKKHKIKEILFYDDHFVFDKKRLIDICNGLIKRKYDLTWGCMARVDSIDIETANLMKKAGCHIISFGVESGSQKMLDSMEKNVKVETIINAFKACKKAGINTKASFIFGSPGETQETIKETQNLLKIILPDYVWFFIMTPMPGTKLYKLHVESGIASDEWSMYNQTTYNKFYGTKLTFEELKKAVSNSYKKYYFSPGYIFSQIKKFSVRKLVVLAKIIEYSFTILSYITKGKL